MTTNELEMNASWSTADNVENYIEEETFEDEVKDILVNGINKDYKVDDITLEIICLKLTHFDRNLTDTLRVCIRVIFEQFIHNIRNEKISTFKFTSGHSKDILKLMHKWKNLFIKLIPDEEHEIQALILIEYIFTSDTPCLLDIIHIVIQYLSVEGIISDNILLEWYYAPHVGLETYEGYKQVQAEEHRKCVDRLSRYIQSFDD